MTLSIRPAMHILTSRARVTAMATALIAVLALSLTRAGEARASSIGKTTRPRQFSVCRGENARQY